MLLLLNMYMLLSLILFDISLKICSNKIFHSFVGLTIHFKIFSHRKKSDKETKKYSLIKQGQIVLRTKRSRIKGQTEKNHS